MFYVFLFTLYSIYKFAKPKIKLKDYEDKN